MKKYIIILLFVCGTLSYARAQEAFEYRVGRFYLGADVGWGYRLGKIIAENDYVRDYLKGLLSGVAAGIDANYYISSNVGFGLKYSLFYASNSFGEVSDKTYINFIAPVFYGRSKPLGAQKIIRLAYSAGVGYLHFKDDWKGVNERNIKIQGTTTGKTYGIYTDFGAEIQLSPRVFLTGKVYLLSGNLTSVTQKTAQGSEKMDFTENPENVSRVGISAGLKFNL